MIKYFKYIFNRIIFLIVLTLIFTGTIILVVSLNSNYFLPLSIMLPCAGIYVIILILFYKWIYAPYQDTKKILDSFVDGFTTQGVFEIQHHISPETEATINKLNESFFTSELINTTRKQAQYLALQNQINPHFLYNKLEGIRSEALIAKLYTVADMSEALGNFFRYTISNMDHLVRLEDELINIENYYLIQRFRFGERINLNIEYSGDNKEVLLKYQLPKLTLQPIVENAVYHGLEGKVGNGILTIKIEATNKRLIITISDDGLGMKKEQLDELLAKINTNSFDYINREDEGKGGIGMVNVNNRIKLLWGEAYGINIFSTYGVGTDVEITMPLIMDRRSSDETGDYSFGENNADT